ncbi:FtsK/SpoIIIE domain-containing protein [Microbacterium sp. ASV49]|uniref:FtsK/SpoIIIE domain-containing protein n=1 Tax=Microbacterium candidum TaxID=3041922 RepID=A0ABT7N1C5_9MICO|nr:FtsK/SpoIIIE domain-containing protein [Microbacterium sp. ASV49]MDL9980509.1 FtsK/SpoIIIE domain-containing protein [Microbacterium sp. ASV49]
MPFADPSAPLALPVPPDPPRRPAVPLLASVVPIVGAAGLALATGSYAMLWFAALGPLIAGATLVDGARAARRARRTAEGEAIAARARIADEIAHRHDVERASVRTRHPDAAALCLTDAGVWRPVPGRGEALVVGSGERESTLRVSGGGDGPEDARLRARAAVLDRAPVTVPLPDGVAVVGPDALAEAVLRALVLQACLVHAPEDLRMLEPQDADRAWMRDLPHVRAGGVRSGGPGRTSVVLGVSGPDSVAPSADVLVARVRPGDPVPARCAAVLTLTSPGRGTLHYAGESRTIEVEAISVGQATALARALAARAGAAGAADGGPVRLADLVPLDRAPASGRGTLSAVIGAAGGAPVAVDLVADGPHAIVAGVTGSGKSELLTTWVTALSAAYPPGEVTFLLADFKGGTAFDALRRLPHVAGVITDLDEAGARRAVESLRAELRRREAALAAAGVRDIGDERGELARLVIVVDEFAALLGTHPDLHAVFTDVAARGRALGMHLVLGTQRASGVVRDALLANCPLRISLRVTEAADSRALLGTDAAADLPGAPEARGLALLRCAADDAPRRMRVALTDPELIAAVAERCTPVPAVRRPWMPALPAQLSLDDLRRIDDLGGIDDVPGPADREGLDPEGLVIGLVDEPDRQRQVCGSLGPRERGLVVLGAAGSGRSTALATLSAQVGDDRLIVVPSDPEGAWDAVEHAQIAAPGSVVVVDDLDALLTRYPLDYAQVMAERIERLARGGGDAGIRLLVGVQRPSGPSARVVELISRRLLLAAASRTDHLAMGGTAELYRRDLPPGRGELDGRAIQVAVASRAVAAHARPPVSVWAPSDAVTGLVLRSGVRPPSRPGFDLVDVRTIADAAVLLGAQRTLIVGDPEAWQRGWRVLEAVRERDELLIDAACAPDFRALTGDRELPPYCAAGTDRAWLLRPGARPVRVDVGAKEPRG